MPHHERAPQLQGFAEIHHEGRLLCWKIRAGNKRGVAPARIRRYCQRYLRTRLKPHFEVEENVLFPILGLDHPGVRRAMAEHRRLQRLINGRTDAVMAIMLVEEELEAHIRFEEQHLFDLIQQVATPGQLQEVEQAHDAQFGHNGHEDRPGDVFWE